MVFSWTDGQWLFYTRLDDAWRPFQVWRHCVGADLPGTCWSIRRMTSGSGWVLGAAATSVGSRSLGTKTTSARCALPADDPEESGGSSRLDARAWSTTSSPTVRACSSSTTVTRRIRSRVGSGRLDLRCRLAPRRPRPRASDFWEPTPRRPPPCSACARGRPDLLRVFPLSDSGIGDPDDLTFDEPIHLVGPGREPDPSNPKVLVGYESFVTPGSVLEIDLATGDREPDGSSPSSQTSTPRYVQHRAWGTGRDQGPGVDRPAHRRPGGRQRPACSRATGPTRSP